MSVASFADMGLFAVFCILSMLLAIAMQLGPYGAAGNVALLPMLAFAGITSAIGTMFGLFRAGEKKSLGVVVTRTMLALAVGVPICYALFAFLPGAAGPRSVLPYAALFTLASVILVRPLLVAAVTTSVGTRRILIVGTGPEARAVEQIIQSQGPKRAVVVGFYPAGAPDEHVTPESKDHAPVFPASLKLQAIVERFHVAEVVVAAREQRGGAIPVADLLDCRVAGVPVTDVSAFYERMRGEVPVESLKASWLIYGAGFVQNPLRALVKRVFDVTAASFLLLLALPVLLLAIIAIYVGTGTPVFFSQERIGRGGRVFRCLKLRTMRVDAECDGVARWATAGDSRVTGVGRLLRKLRVDEIPQLLNVLNGDMSLVGPRPERPIFVEQLRQEIRFYDLRHSIKPGVTGWAQIRYPYGSSVTDAQHKLQYDLFYVKNHSLVLDVLILAETVRVVLFGEGAQ